MTDDEQACLNGYFVRQEPGWADVSRGLLRILLGNLVLVGGILFCAGIVWYTIDDLRGSSTEVASNKLGAVWVFFLALGAFTLTVMFAIGLLVRGQWLCLMGAPERCGARWMMLACISCILFGPALNFIFGFSGMERTPNMDHGAACLNEIELSTAGITMQIASSMISMASHVLFIIFLRSVAHCFGDEGRVMNATCYLTFQGLIYLGPIFLYFVDPSLLREPAFLPGLAMAWVASFFWYLYLVLSIQTCIASAITSARTAVQY